MHYDRYLAAGYPIASGVVEGACRHVVKDRLERAGMHWTIDGARAMLNILAFYHRVAPASVGMNPGLSAAGSSAASKRRPQSAEARR